MEYREIIREEIRKIMGKKSKLPEEEQGYWDRIISKLLADLRDYETGGRERWPGEASAPHQPKVENLIAELFRRFFEDDFSFP